MRAHDIGTWEAHQNGKMDDSLDVKAEGKEIKLITCMDSGIESTPIKSKVIKLFLLRVRIYRASERGGGVSVTKNVEPT